MSVGATASKWTISTSHVSKVGSTWGQHWPTRRQLGPNLGSTWQLRPKLGSTCLQNGEHGWPYPENTNVYFYFPQSFFDIDDMSQVNRSCACLGPSWAQESASWAQVRSCPVQPGPSSAHPGPMLRLTAISNILLGVVRFHLPVLGPTSVPNAPTEDQVAHVKPLDPSWAQDGQVRANWPTFGTSYDQVGPKLARVRPNLRARTANFDPRPLWSASFLSSMFPGCGRYWSRSDSNTNKEPADLMCMLDIIAP